MLKVENYTYGLGILAAQDLFPRTLTHLTWGVVRQGTELTDPLKGGCDREQGQGRAVCPRLPSVSAYLRKICWKLHTFMGSKSNTDNIGSQKWDKIFLKIADFLFLPFRVFRSLRVRG